LDAARPVRRYAFFAAALLAAAPFLVLRVSPAFAQNPQVRFTSFTSPDTVRPGEKFDVLVQARVDGTDATQGGISVSFPTNPQVELIKTDAGDQPNTQFTLYQANDPRTIFSVASNSSVTPKYPLAESYWQRGWPAGTEHYVQLRVTAPESGSVPIYARVGLRNRDNQIVQFPASGAVLDQQGFPVAVRNVMVVPQQAATPTQVPAPTAVPPAVTVAPTSAPPSAAGSPTPSSGASSGDLSGIGYPILLALGLLSIGFIAVTTVAVVALARRPSAPPPPYRPPETAAATYVPAPPMAETRLDTQPVELPSDSATAFQAGPPQISDVVIERLIGRGGMASVFLARQPSLNRQVALKVMSDSLTNDTRMVERFWREARMAATLEHPQIVPIYEVGYWEGRPAIVMRYIAGHSLSERIRQGRLPLATIAVILDQLARALDYAHSRGVIHRDVKPGNVLIEERPSTETDETFVYLTDFGIARALNSGESRLTVGNVVIGTVEYMSPEQVRDEELTGASDNYSLGIILYEMISGRIPFSGDSALAIAMHQAQSPPPPVSLVVPEYGSMFDVLLLTALAKLPQDRFSSAGALAAAFREIVSPGG
jgi:serine/threonine-protein kinase